MIYLDNAATTMNKPAQVRRAMLEAFDNCTNAGRGGYRGSLAASERIFSAREIAAELFGCSDPGQIVFTSNATHSLNIAIKGIVTHGDCVISGYEHNSVVRPLVSMRKFGVTYSVAGARLFDSEELVSEFSKKINRNTSCAVCTHESNVFGYILPIKEIDDLCFKKGIPLIIDASQSAGSISIKLSELRATVCICAPGHKGLYGPQGTGILICRAGENINSLIDGGTGSASGKLEQPEFMPDRHESGTQNTPGIAGLAAGMKYVIRRTPEKIMKHERELIRYAVDELRKIPGIRVYAAKEADDQGGVLSFVSDKVYVEDMVYKLSKRDIAVRGGMHCAPLAHETAGTQNGTVRISVSDFSTAEEIEALIWAVKKISR